MPVFARTDTICKGILTLDSVPVMYMYIYMYNVHVCTGIIYISPKYISINNKRILTNQHKNSSGIICV